MYFFQINSFSDLQVQKNCMQHRENIFLLTGHKVNFISPSGASKSIFKLPIEKKSVDFTGSSVEFTNNL